MPGMSRKDGDWVLLAALAAEGVLLLVVIGLLAVALLSRTELGIMVQLGSIVGLLGAVIALLVAMMLTTRGRDVRKVAERERRPVPPGYPRPSPADAMATEPREREELPGRHRSQDEPEPREKAPGPAADESGPSRRANPQHVRGEAVSQAAAPPTTQPGSLPSREESSLPLDEPEFEDGAFSSSSSRSPADLDPRLLIDAWESYRLAGDGHFDAAGLRRKLGDVGLEPRVLSARELGLSDEVLGVQSEDGGNVVFLLPNFHLVARALEPWFVDEGASARTSRISRVRKPARGRRTSSGFTLEEKGIVA